MTRRVGGGALGCAMVGDATCNIAAPRSNGEPRRAGRGAVVGSGASKTSASTGAFNGPTMGLRRMGGMPSGPECETISFPHFQHRLTAPINSSPQLEHSTDMTCYFPQTDRVR